MAEEVEYESDPEEAKLSLKMRRRVASDDEGEVEEEEEEMERREKVVLRIDSDGESVDGQGGAADYGDHDEEEEEEEYFEEEEGEYEEECVNGEGAVERRGNREDGDVVAVYSEVGGGLGVESTGDDDGENKGKEWGVDQQQGGGEGEGEGEAEGEGEGEKKEQEPYAVPTAGAFYMHDDRFQDNVGGRNRRMLGGRQLWESKDERKWGHDKFEELTMHDRPYDEGRRSGRGRNRGRGRSRGAPRGHSPLSTPKSYENNKYQVTDTNKYQVNDNNQNTAPRSVKGRGPRRYQSSAKANPDAPAPQKKQYRKSLEKPSQSGRANVPASNSDPNYVPAKKQEGSSLNYASPPFYPSNSSNKGASLTQKEDAQGRPASRNVQPPVVDQSFHRPQSNSVVSGKSNMGSVGMDKLYTDDSTTARKSNNSKFAPSGTRPNNSSQPQNFRGHGRGPNVVPQTSYQPTSTTDLVNKFAFPTHTVQRNSAHSQIPAAMQASSHQFDQRSSSVSQSSSPPKTVVPINSPEAGELDSQLESSKSKMSFIGKGNVNMQGGGRGSYIYGGGQVMGPSGDMIAGHGDKNLPAFYPVMQLGGQHPGGMGVPAVGMAFPGYVGNPQLGNSEMTWLPVLAGAAGALGASYCPPYFSVDGAYHARPSAQSPVPSNASSNEVSNISSKDELKPSKMPELVNDDFGQRQKNPRRYTEMKFDQ